MSSRSDIYYTAPLDGQLYQRSWIFSVTDGPDQHAAAEHNQSTAILGAANASILPLSDDTVSRYHVELELSADDVLVRDLDSTNGTFVDDEPIQESLIKDGERFRLGNTEIIIQTQDQSVEPDIDRLIKAPDKLLSQVPEYFVAESQDYLRLLASARFNAPTNVNVLLLGGKGAGKNELARYIHQCSGRQEGNMFTLTIPLNASIASMNTALFGMGNAAKDGEAPGPGLLERASGSTLYIEHLERLPPVTRSQLRTALQSGSTRRLGETEQRRIDVRLISATTVSELADTNLPPNVLAYLAPIQLTLPDLGHREQDIHAMAERVLASPGRPRAWIGPRFAHALKGQAWKQNLDSLRTTLSWLRHHPLDADPLQQARITDHIILSRGNVTEVAGKLGVSTEALFRYLARFDIDLEEEDLSPST